MHGWLHQEIRVPTRNLIHFHAALRDASPSEGWIGVGIPHARLVCRTEDGNETRIVKTVLVVGYGAPHQAQSVILNDGKRLADQLRKLKAGLEHAVLKVPAQPVLESTVRAFLLREIEEMLLDLLRDEARLRTFGT